MRKKIYCLLVVIIVLSLSGCGWWKDTWGKKQRVRNVPEILYQAGIEAFQTGKYKQAVENFTRVKEQFPLHSLALLAEIGIADAQFSDGQYPDAELAYTDYLNLHPTNENIPYVMYQIGMCHYSQMQTIDRDQTETVRTAKDFEKLIARFPNSKFAVMAEKKLQECRQRLAQHEFYVGEFYLKRGFYQAALNRFEYLAKNYPSLGVDYQTSRYLAESKKRLAQAEAEKAKEEAKKAKKEAGKNAKKNDRQDAQKQNAQKK